MMSADGVYERPIENTPKRRSHGPWLVEHFSKVSDSAQEENAEEPQCSKRNIVKIEKENRRTDEYLASRLKTDKTSSPIHNNYSTLDKSANRPSHVVETDEDGIEKENRRTDEYFASRLKTDKTSSPVHNDYSTLDKSANRPSHIVETDEDGYAIPSAERRSGQLTPLGQEFEPPTFKTPPNANSPDELFFTPMTHPRPNERKERRTTKLGPSCLLGNPSIPPFSDDRQTLDPAQLDKLCGGDVVCDAPLRHSLPATTSRKTPGSSSTFVFGDGGEDNHGAYAVSPVSCEKASVHRQRHDISLPKVLGASMAAELAYAEKAEQVRTHLDATRQLAMMAGREVDQQFVQRDSGDDIDRILDSISLRDESLRSTEENETMDQRCTR
ncbi:unnamed protein product [Strongylus vulgaris]|uniref:Uncharacterized protein n=1 Tax=Strongylus vulgaris TaxID=40348 RepID=A0A3P7LF22_STRVU|nr:unnamed protein product [Strongylus vulgaris]